MQASFLKDFHIEIMQYISLQNLYSYSLNSMWDSNKQNNAIEYIFCTEV